MEPAFSSVYIQTTLFSPVEAELTVFALLDQPATGLELCGRLMGPRSVGTETVEIAYSLRPIPSSEDDLLKSRVIIPEPNLWEPKRPFLYEGPVELWRREDRLQSVSVSHGLRHVLLKKKGLYWNGQPLTLNALSSKSLDEELARQFHAAGVNLVLVPAGMETASIWSLADRYGLLVLGQIDPEDEDFLWYAEAHLSRRTCCFGWLLPQATLAQPQRWHQLMSLLHGQTKELFIGIRVEEPPLGVLPGHVSFLVCDEPMLPELAEVSLPKLVMTRRENPESPTDLNTLGWVRRRPN